MHNQVLVIYPQNRELDDVMYWYQEVDKYQNKKMADDRCQFILSIKDDEISDFLNQIKEKLEKDIKEYSEMIKYRSKHTLNEFKEKYGFSFKDYFFDIYKQDLDALKEYEKVKDLSIDDPNQIKFIKKHSGSVTDDFIGIYINGIGYGSFGNPYQIWDYYDVVDAHRFLRGTHFLISKNGKGDNQMFFNDLDIGATVNNIKEYTRVWEYIIFCEDDPSQSRIYTIDDIRFNYSYNKHCLVDNLEEVLVQLSDNYTDDKEYIITALDFHW